MIGLLQRPRVSHKISEYVFSFIDENILKPNRILQSDKRIYWFTLSFSFSIPKPNRILYTSPFSTKTRLYVPHKGFRTVEGKKWAFLSVTADDISQETSPYDYAMVVYDMVADYLLYNYKKLDKSSFEQTRLCMDRSYIDSFRFPAPFEEQKYSVDDGTYPVSPQTLSNGWISLDKWVQISPKEEYLKHYPY